MRHGKHEALGSRKARIAAVALVLILCCSIGGTLAWLAASTNSVTNTFKPAQVECSVTDTYRNNEKTNIKVSIPDNVKNADAYVRVTLVPTWEDAQGNAVAMPAEITYPDSSLNSSWFKDGDYYYYKNILKVGDETPALFNSAITVPDSTGDYTLNLQVLAEAIQADGMDGEAHPVATVWPVSVAANGSLSAKG